MLGGGLMDTYIIIKTFQHLVFFKRKIVHENAYSNAF